MPKSKGGEPDELARLNVRIPAALLKRLQKRAIDQDLFLQEAVAKAVELWLKA